MSAIWGIIDFKGNRISKRSKDLLKNSFARCVIDRVEELCEDGVYLGCGIQYFTEEAKFERMPTASNDKYMTADVVIDNRDELYSMLIDKSILLQDMPDGMLLNKIYVEEGYNCLDRLLGAYAFVYYDRNANYVDIVIDSVGDRCVYYTMYNNILYFSSLMEPLVKIIDADLNDRWITDFLAMDHLFMFNEAEETPYKGIYRVAPAQRVTIHKDRITKEIYWRPFDNLQEIHLANDNDYSVEFNKVFGDAVRDAMRCTGSLSILLSGGLDSNAVAAVASNILKEKGDKLYSYTSVPLTDYEIKDDGYHLEDEAQAVKKTAEILGNIEPSFIDMDGIDAWNGREREVEIMEMPYKSVQNMLWIPECMRQAYLKGSRIMLTGSYGNTTISYTNLEVYMNDLYQKRRYITLKKELKRFARTNGFSARYAWKQIKYANKESKALKTDWNSLYGKSFVRSSMINETKADARMIEMQKRYAEANLSIENARKLMIQDVALRQIGEAGTKHSLATGVLLRDPTKDKRVIEYCLRLPINQFCRDGVERRLVREYMRHIVPKHILEAKTKGRQSADLGFRMSLRWDQIKNEWIEIYKSNLDSKYVDCALACKQLDKNCDITEYNSKALVRHVYTLMIVELENKFINTKKSKTKDETVQSEDKPLISVIIPVYNVVGDLKKCIESVLKQSYKRLEILLIDDGSIDGSGELCNEIALSDERVRVIHQENAGISNAKNKGIDCATGQLIGFVDADTVIEYEMYEKMVVNIQKYHAEIVCCAYKQILTKGDLRSGEISVLHGAELFETYLANKNGHMTGQDVCNILFTRELIGDDRFPDAKKYEDQVFVCQVLNKVTKGVYINKSFCHNKSESKLTNKCYGLSEIQEYISTQEILLNTIKNNNKIRKQYYYSRVEVFYCVLLEWYCGNNRKRLHWNERKYLLSELKKIKADAIIGIENKENVSRRYRYLLKLSIYSVGAYFLAVNIMSFVNKIKKCFIYVRK